MISTYYYALVLRKTVAISSLDKNAAIKLLDRYEKLIDHMISKYSDTEVSYTYEIEEKKDFRINLHLHAMLKSTMPYTLISPPRQKGMSTYFEECSSPLTWVIYCSKCPFTREDVLEYIDYQIYGTIPNIKQQNLECKISARIV